MQRKKMTKKEKEKLKKEMKILSDKVKLHQKIRSTPFSYNRPGRMVQALGR